MDERFSYCPDCINKGMCRNCYRGSHYQPNPKTDDYYDDDV